MASMDALGAFTHMKDNLPAWINRVSELATHTHKKHGEYSEAYRRHANFKPRRRKNSSVCSIHTDDLVPIAQRKGPSPEPVAIETPQDAPEQGQRSGRKRTTDEAPSVESNEEYDTLVSTRHNVIIEYDGHTQQTLETIVRDIGVARNNIRRGQMALMPRTGLRAGLLSKGMNMPSGLGQTGPLSCVRSTRTTAGLVGVSGTTALRKDSPFDFADKQLELAHSLCETAAYQVLRSGDCGTELDGVEEKFKMLLEAAINEVDRIMAEKKQQEEHEQKQQEGTAEEGPPKPPPTPSAARLAKVAAIAASKPSMAAGTIEVDDNSSLSAESLDLSAFRSSRMRA
ncbi:hypothetical protein N7497_009460 [Penicillium chrysogenum]|jgi:hypothetical protein|nr:hypothetical protein N7524_007630 [Penicillium chrysogenum]KAJ6147478.1 hypothetical protein N7497_009460 [Penicillium chrysogenum]